LLSEDEFQTAFKEIMKDPAYKMISTSFDKYFSADNYTLSYIRTFINYGLPLKIDGKTFDNKTDRLLEQ